MESGAACRATFFPWAEKLTAGIAPTPRIATITVITAPRLDTTDTQSSLANLAVQRLARGLTPSAPMEGACPLSDTTHSAS